MEVGKCRYVRCVNLNFIETTCAICEERFEDGDVLELLVKTINDENYTMTIPIHSRCKDKTATITTDIPVFTTKYVLDEGGNIQEVLAPAYEEIEEEILRTHPEFEFDEDTGQFKRKVTEENAVLYGLGNLQKGIVASRRAALVTDTVVRRKPRRKTIQVQVGTPLE